MTYFELNINGELKRVRAQMVGPNLWFHVDGATYTLEASTRRSAQGSAVAGDGTVLAPMPGKILKLNCKEGQQVKAGQLLLVMEAMKMEYSFAAEHDGKVVSVGCKEGDQVSVMQLLVKVEKANG